MAGNFEIDVQGTTAVVVALKADTERAKRLSKSIVVQAAREAEKTMRSLAPEGEPEEGQATTHETIKERVTSDRMAVYSPGGVGGGGNWTARAGVRRSARWPDESHDPASLVFEGTGLYGKTPHMIESRAGNLMVFKYEGRWFRLRQMKGQEPQTDWVTRSQDRANAAVKAGVAYFAEKMRRGA